MIVTKQEYLDTLSTLKSRIDESIISEKERKAFLFTSINKQKVLSSIDHSSDVEFYKDTVLYQKWREIDQKTEFNILLENIQASGDITFSNDANQGPFIFCGFHYGAYNLIPFMLKKKGIEFVTVAVEENMIEDLVQFKRDVKTKDFSQKSDTIKSSGFQVLLQMLQALKSGKNILVFIDGGNGTTKVNDTEKLRKISFLNEKIFTRTGVLELAYKMNTPIIPIVAKREEDKSVNVFFSSQIRLEKDLPKEEAIENCVSRIYSELETFVKKDPAQWEVWDVLHLILAPAEEHPYLKYWNYFRQKFKPKKLLTVNSVLHFNEDDFGFYQDETSCYVIQKSSMDRFKISSLTYNVLKSLEYEKSNISRLRQLLPIDVLSKILKKRVFVSSK
ncbi:hypothetical protein JKA74_09625 [Marivirga sp. S37H4]|uniref:Lipid A biosynthesis acyltransferase n=1 Tax=Marivirga aurantiaca TaxID=2802615 RepID=A0A935C870_9BACT|nr:hypothetical protein [Marivirga aurantiaca]MBK6265299.1 hypothetical protein [Marivirga aurantiaca]